MPGVRRLTASLGISNRGREGASSSPRVPKRTSGSDRARIAPEPGPTSGFVGVRCSFKLTRNRLRQILAGLPAPRLIEDIDAAFVVKDSAGQKLGYFYYEEEPGRRSTAKLLSKD